jgi:hypothetical protein
VGFQSATAAILGSEPLFQSGIKVLLYIFEKKSFEYFVGYIGKVSFRKLFHPFVCSRSRACFIGFAIVVRVDEPDPRVFQTGQLWLDFEISFESFHPLFHFGRLRCHPAHDFPMFLQDRFDFFLSIGNFTVGNGNPGASRLKPLSEAFKSCGKLWRKSRKIEVFQIRYRRGCQFVRTHMEVIGSAPESE